jgi:SNW domain-containing protein 1
MSLVSKRDGPPVYGARAGWIPRSADDFGDGGSFPEIHIPQYPLEMGRKKSSGAGKSTAMAVQVNSDGKIKYDLLLRQGKDANKIIPHQLHDLLPSEVMHNDDPELQKPTEEELLETVERTRHALQAMVSSKVEGSLPSRGAEKVGPAQYIRYTPSDASGDHNSGATQRIIRMVEVQQDPMEPPKFRNNAKIPQAPSSPPPPVMHSPPRKITVKEQQEWKIPPCISNWKNAKGYTIPLDKRLAADGRGLQQVHINEKFAKLSEGLYIAERKAREAVELRAQMERKRAQKEKEEKEETLRKLAQKARDERAGIRSHAQRSSDDSESEDESVERDQIRQERHRDRQRDRNLQRAAPEKRSRLERERDVSEQIALGLAGAKGNGGEVQFDQRLFNQSKGVASGFGDDEEYNVYDQPWRSQAAFAQNLYRPTRSKEDDAIDDLDQLASASRFVPDKGFSGADKNAKRDGPVSFEKAASSSTTLNDEDDPFGLDKFLTEAKKASKPKHESKHDSRSSHKRRKD